MPSCVVEINIVEVGVGAEAASVLRTLAVVQVAVQVVWSDSWVYLEKPQENEQIASDKHEYLESKVSCAVERCMCSLALLSDLGMVRCPRVDCMVVLGSHWRQAWDLSYASAS